MDLSLPATWPSEARFDAMDLLPTALFTLIELDESELERIRQACESGCVETGNEPNSSVRIAPQPTFVGQPLRAAFDYFGELRTRDEALEFDPKHFIVVVSDNWTRRGVLVVTLDDGEGEGQTGNVDTFFVRAEDAGLSILNIQIGNSDWDEIKSNYEFEAGSEDDGDDGDDDHDNDAGGDHADEPDQASPGSVDDDDLGGPPPPKEGDINGFCIPIYIHSQLQPDDVLQQLEPMIRHKRPSQYACRIQDSLCPSSSASSASNDIVAQAVSLHPLRCARNKWLFQTMLLVVDTPDPAENGMLMARLDLKGLAHDASSYNKDALIQMGEALAGALDSESTIRLPYNCQYGLQRPFLTIANGDAAWPSEAARRRPKFSVCQYNTPGEGFGFGSDLIYSGVAYKQEYSQEQLVYDQELLVREEFNGSAQSFEEAVHKFPLICRENRLVENFDTRYFICIDSLDIADTGVLLVRRHWDGNVWGRTNRELMELDITGVRSTRVPAKDALEILTKGRTKDTEDMALELVEFFTERN